MEPNEAPDLQRIVEEERKLILKHWKLFMAVGIVLVVLGTLAIILPTAASLALELVIGVALLLGGVGQAAHAFATRRWGGFALELFGAVVYIAGGILLLAFPITGVATLTLFLAALFLAEGVTKLFFAMKMKAHDRWGWVFLSGIISLVLAVILFAGWPGDSIWILGLIFGINLIFGGWAAIMTAWGLHKAHSA